MLHIRAKTLETLIGHVTDVMHTLEDDAGHIESVAVAEYHKVEAAVKGMLTSLTGHSIEPAKTSPAGDGQ